MKFFQDGGGRHLGFVRIGNSAIRSAVPENSTLEPNTAWVGLPVAEIWPFEIFPRWRLSDFRKKLSDVSYRLKDGLQSKLKYLILTCFFFT